MHAPLLFHKRYGLPALWLGVIAAMGILFTWLLAAPGEVFTRTEGTSESNLVAPLVGAFLAAAGMVLLFGLIVVAVDDEGMRTGLLRVKSKCPPRLRWADVKGVAFSRFDIQRPALILEYEKSLRWRAKGPEIRKVPAYVRLTSAWADHERLFVEILKRLPHLRPDERLLAYLAAPRGVPPRARAATLLALTLSLCGLGYGCHEALRYGMIGLFSLAAIGVSVIACFLLGGAVSREWPWKGSLVTAGAAFACLVFPFFLLAATFLGTNAPLVLLLGGGLAWAVVTYAVCLPWRPKGWLVAAAYAVAIPAGLALAREHGIREPYPVRETPVLPGVSGPLVWSPDGRLLCTPTDGRNGKPGSIHVVDASSLTVNTYPVEGGLLSVRVPDGRTVLCVAAQTSGDDGPRTDTLWALATGSGKLLRLHQAEHISISSTGFVSHDGARVAFMAGSRKKMAVYTLHLMDLSVRPVDMGLTFASYARATWGPGDALLIHEIAREETPEAKGGMRARFWVLARGESRPACVYDRGDRWVSVDVVPNSRWAVVGFDAQPDERKAGRLSLREMLAFGSDWDTADRCEIVDMVTGESRPLAAPLPRRSIPLPYWLVAGAPDGSAFAYGAADPEGYSLVCVAPATGKASRPYGMRDGRLVRVGLSRDARYAVCVVRHDIASLLRVVEVPTGSATRLRRNMAWPFFEQVAWSPVGDTLAVAHYALSDVGVGTVVRLHDVGQ